MHGIVLCGLSSFLLSAATAEWTSLVPISCTGPGQFHGNDFFHDLCTVTSLLPSLFSVVDAVVDKMPSFEVREIRKNNVSKSYVGQTLDSRVVGQSSLNTDYLEFKWFVYLSLILSLNEIEMWCTAIFHRKIHRHWWMDCLHRTSRRD